MDTLEPIGSAPPTDLPHFDGGSADAIRRAAVLRAAAHHRLAAADLAEIFLPSLWTRTDELEGAEIRVEHDSLEERKLYLQRFPELPALMALAGGLSDWYPFGHCWRAQPEFGTPPQDNLLEFEQLTIGRAAWSMAEMLAEAT